MIIDIIIFSLCLLGIYRGYKQGFLRKLFSIISIFVGYFLSVIFSSRLSLIFAEFIPINDNAVVSKFNATLTNLDIPSGYHKFIAFITIFFIVQIVIKMIANGFGIFTKLPVINTANKLLGAILGFLQIYIVIFIIIYLIYILPISSNIQIYFLNATFPNIIFEQTPILSDLILKNIFNYINK